MSELPELLSAQRTHAMSEALRRSPGSAFPTLSGLRSLLRSAHAMAVVRERGWEVAPLAHSSDGHVPGRWACRRAFDGRVLSDGCASPEEAVERAVFVAGDAR